MRGLDNAGAVNVVYSTKSGTGLTTLGNQYWFQGFTEQGLVFGVPEAGDQFGISVAAGDFNRDGISDLAIGVPGEGGGAGAVTVLYGSMNGLTNINSEFFQEGSSLSGLLQGTR